MEAVIAVAKAFGHRVLLRQRGTTGGVGDGVGHVHKTGNATSHRRRTLGGDIALVGEPWGTEVHLVIDHAGH